MIKYLVGLGLGKCPIVAQLYKTISYILWKNKIVDCSFFKMKLFTNGHVSNVVSVLMFKNEYEPITTKVFKQLLKLGDTVIDIGANVGYFSLLSKIIVGDTGRVYAFEPNKNNSIAIFQNAELNSLKVSIIPVALSDKAGKASFYLSSADSEHSLIKSSSHLQQISIDVYKLDSFHFDKVDLIKIDVEGNEFAVLQGAKQIIQNNPNINLIVEISKQGDLLQNIWHYLRSLDMKYFYAINENRKSINECMDICDIEKNYSGSYINLLCSRTDFL